jgi:excisionase family DNA binding protein
MQNHSNFSSVVTPHTKLHTIPKRLFNLDEAAIYLGIPRKTIKEMCINGEILFVRRSDQLKDRRRYYIDKGDMDHWIESHKQSNGGY